MADKKNNKYKVRLQEIQLKDGTTPGASIEFEFENHDNIFNLIEQTKDSQWFEDKSQNTEFIVGLKLLGEVIIRNRKNPLFEELSPAFGQFMKKLKKGSREE